jgi:hypothetical protein
LGIGVLVEFVRFARGGELGSNGCVRFRGRPRALVVSTVIDSSSFDSLSNSNKLPLGSLLLFLLFFGIFPILVCTWPQAGGPELAIDGTADDG